MLFRTAPHTDPSKGVALERQGHSRIFYFADIQANRRRVGQSVVRDAVRRVPRDVSYEQPARGMTSVAGEHVPIDRGGQDLIHNDAMRGIVDGVVDPRG